MGLAINKQAFPVPLLGQPFHRVVPFAFDF
jgi:hypothetical protein